MDFRKPGSWCTAALEKGITATAGAVWEPGIEWYIEGDTLLDAFVVDGVSLAEAAWRAIPTLEWMMIVFGDPLYSMTRVYPKPMPPEPQPEPAPEPPAEPLPDAAPDSAVEDLPNPFSDTPGDAAKAAPAPPDATAASDAAPGSAPGQGGGCNVASGRGPVRPCLLVLSAAMASTGILRRRRLAARRRAGA
jgi:hypothetical protein